MADVVAGKFVVRNLESRQNFIPTSGQSDLPHCLFNQLAGFEISEISDRENTQNDPSFNLDKIEPPVYD
jgi:hypothetical protein